MCLTPEKIHVGTSTNQTISCPVSRRLHVPARAFGLFSLDNEEPKRGGYWVFAAFSLSTMSEKSPSMASTSTSNGP